MRVIDFHDDRGTAFLAAGEALPELLKTGQAKERTDLGLRDYALILVDRDDGFSEHPKFACYDEASTWMSLWYLENGDHGLPAGAEKVAAANLVTIAAEQGLDVRGSFPRVVSLAQKEAATAIEYGILATFIAVGLLTAGKVLTSQARTMVAQSAKGREPYQLQNLPPKMQAAVRKHDPQGPYTRLSVASTLLEAFKAGTITKQDFQRHYDLEPFVSGNKISKKPSFGKTASAPDSRRVVVSRRDFAPLPSPAPAKMAAFDKVAQMAEGWDYLSGYDRRCAALEVEKLAGLVGIPEKIQEYMGHGAGPHIRDEMAVRARSYAKTAEVAADYVRVGEMAKAGALDPEDAVEAIHILDEASGFVVPDCYGNRMHDPYRCVYGIEKEAEYSWIDGGHYVNGRQLQQFAASPASTFAMGDLFIGKTVTAFRLAPLKTFEALPREQKILVARLATQSGYSDDGNILT